MSKENIDTGKVVVVNVQSDGEEIEYCYEQFTNQRFPPKKCLYTLPVDEYQYDHKDRSPKIRTFFAKRFGTQKPDEIKNLIGVEYSQFIVKAYKLGFHPVGPFQSL